MSTTAQIVNFPAIGATGVVIPVTEAPMPDRTPDLPVVQDDGTVEIVKQLDEREDLIVSVESVEVSRLRVDDGEGGYQRDISDLAVRKIMRAFDAKQFEPITVSIREDNTYWVVDGHHRYIAAKRLGFTEVPCRLIYGLSQAEEAQLFRDMAKGRIRIDPLDEHRAALVAGDPVAMGIQEIIDAHGFVFRRGYSHPIESGDITLYPLQSVRTVYAIYRMDTGVTLNRTLGLVIAAWGENDPIRTLRRSYLGALGRILHRYWEDLNRDKVAAYLGKTAPSVIQSRAELIITQQRLNRPVEGYTMALIEAYNRNIRSAAKRLSYDRVS